MSCCVFCGTPFPLASSTSWSVATFAKVLAREVELEGLVEFCLIGGREELDWIGTRELELEELVESCLVGGREDMELGLSSCN